MRRACTANTSARRIRKESVHHQTDLELWGELLQQRPSRGVEREVAGERAALAPAAEVEPRDDDLAPGDCHLRGLRGSP